MLVILSSVLAVCAGELNAQTPPGTVIRNLATVIRKQRTTDQS